MTEPGGPRASATISNQEHYKNITRIMLDHSLTDVLTYLIETNAYPEKVQSAPQDVALRLITNPREVAPDNPHMAQLKGVTALGELAEFFPSTESALFIAETAQDATWTGNSDLVQQLSALAVKHVEGVAHEIIANEGSTLTHTLGDVVNVCAVADILEGIDLPVDVNYNPLIAFSPALLLMTQRQEEAHAQETTVLDEASQHDLDKVLARTEKALVDHGRPEEAQVFRGQMKSN
jgi:hypothetical protein